MIAWARAWLAGQAEMWLYYPVLPLPCKMFDDSGFHVRLEIDSWVGGWRAAARWDSTKAEGYSRFRLLASVKAMWNVFVMEGCRRVCKDSNIRYRLWW